MPQAGSKCHMIFNNISPSASIRNLARNLSEDSTWQICFRHCDNLKNSGNFLLLFNDTLETLREPAVPATSLKQNECNCDKYPVMFMCPNPQQNHAEEGSISVKEITGHSEKHVADLSEQIWKMGEMLYFGVFWLIGMRADNWVPCYFEYQEQFWWSFGDIST